MTRTDSSVTSRGTLVGEATDETARRGVWRRYRNLMEVM
jgi:hypothetical protein